jgi:hypothetical protein
VGIVLVAVAVAMFLFTDYSVAGPIAMGTLGLTSIAISRRSQGA